MPTIDLVDDTFVVAPPQRVAEVVADPRRWRSWWPDLRLTTTRDRGVKGRQWRVDGALVGTAELWLEPWRDGVIVHCYLRCDPADPADPDNPADAALAVDRERRRRAQAWKRVVHALKDALEQEVKDGGAGADVHRDRDEGPEEAVSR